MYQPTINLSKTARTILELCKSMVKLLLSDKCLTVLVFHNKDFMTVAAICLFHIITSKLQDLYFCDEQRYVYRKSLFTAGELVAGSIMQDHSCTT